MKQINKIWNYHGIPESLKLAEMKLFDLEDWSQRKNCRFNGIIEKEDEIWNECKQELYFLEAILV